MRELQCWPVATANSPSNAPKEIPVHTQTGIPYVLLLASSDDCAFAYLSALVNSFIVASLDSSSLAVTLFLFTISLYTLTLVSDFARNRLSVYTYPCPTETNQLGKLSNFSLSSLSVTADTAANAPSYVLKNIQLYTETDPLQFDMLLCRCAENWNYA